MSDTFSYAIRARLRCGFRRHTWDRTMIWRRDGVIWRVVVCCGRCQAYRSYTIESAELRD